MERTRLIKIIKRLEPDYNDVVNFEELSFIELRDLYVKLVRDKRSDHWSKLA